MTQRVVFLDRDSLKAKVRKPSCATQYLEHAKTSIAEIVPRLTDATVAIVNKVPMRADTLKQLPALLERADLVMTPDSGPMHIANAMGSKVLGLHAASNPGRSGPYSDRRYCVDRYDDAARRFLGKAASELKWGTKIEVPGAMDLVGIDDAIAAFERFRADREAR